LPARLFFHLGERREPFGLKQVARQPLLPTFFPQFCPFCTGIAGVCANSRSSSGSVAPAWDVQIWCTHAAECNTPLASCANATREGKKSLSYSPIVPIVPAVTDLRAAHRSCRPVVPKLHAALEADHVSANPMRPNTLSVIGLVCLAAITGGCAIFERPVATIATDSLPRELDKVSLPPYVVEPPDIVLIQVSPEVTLPGLPLAGQFVVRPDGTVALGAYGELYVAGRTLEEIKQMIFAQLSQRLETLAVEDIFVDVLAYNSKVYYIITDGAGSGEDIDRLPSTGNETVLDALSYVGGLSAVSSKDRVWIARPSPLGGPTQIIPVDWKAIVEHGSTATNYQVMPGDRIYVKADPLVTIDTLVAKLTTPVERVLGNVLLWNITVNRLEGNFQRGGTGF
jgi:polysaccharide export outer membrane protein